MNQKEFIEELYKTGRFRRKEDVKIFVEIFIETLKKNIEDNQKVTLTNFGTFRLLETEKQVYVPTRKEIIRKDNLKNIKFKLSNNMKKKINKT